MKFLLFILFFILIFYLNYSTGRTLNDNQERINNVTKISEEISVTTCKYINKLFILKIVYCFMNISLAWWTRTFPITVTRTAKPRSRPQFPTTTIPTRISRTVLITVPVVIFAVTILFGFGLITFALITHGNGVSFLTRTNERRLS